MQRIRRSLEGWTTPLVSSLNRWVMNAFHGLWEPSQPLTPMGALVLWKEAVDAVPPPEGMKPGAALYLQLQETFDLLGRHDQETGGPSKGLLLADWRREVTGHFLGLLERHRLWSWPRVIKRVEEAVASGKIRLPERVLWVAFDDLYPAETRLAEALGKRSTLALWQASTAPGSDTRIRVFTTPEQECQAVCGEVLRSWNGGVRWPGVVFLDRDYFPLLKRCFEELADREPKPEHALRYNLTLGTPLTEHPLFQAALLPLRLLEEDRPHLFLSSLLCSPFVKKTFDDWDHGIRADLWNSGQGTDGSSVPESSLEELLTRLARRGYPVQHLQRLSALRRSPLERWLQSLQKLWRGLGFPVCVCETDQLSRNHLLTLMETLEKEAGRLEVGPAEVIAWISTSAQGVEVVEKTPETAGIQVLSAIEARGLAFDRLWVVGVHGRVLPQPVRELPLLDPEELRQMTGGTTEAQWDRGQRDLAHLLAAAPEVRFSRAVSKGEEAPFLPCPLVPDESPDRPPRSLNLWEDPPQEWLRARWLRRGFRGLLEKTKEPQAGAIEKVSCSLPESLSVTALENLLACPFRFFSAYCLALEPLDEEGPGMKPAERGRVIHDILRKFTAGLKSAAPEWPESEEKAEAFLEKTVNEVLAEKGDHLLWEVERRRLLGDGKSPGLLREWLKMERERAREGWRFELAETVFRRLRVGDTGFTLDGRVDRVDAHPTKGKELWDYKTGEPPSPKEILELMVRPQLPAYLLSMKEGQLPCRCESLESVGGGYITLKKASEVKATRLKAGKEEINWEQLLKRWMEWVRERSKGPREGDYDRDPLPPPSGRNGGACQYCPFPNVCGLEVERLSPESEEGPEERGR